MRDEYFIDRELCFENEDLVSVIDISTLMLNAMVDVKVYQKQINGQLREKAWVMSEFCDNRNTIKFVDLYSYEKSKGFSSLAVSILIQVYKSIMDPELIAQTKCIGNLSCVGDQYPVEQHKKRVEFWSAFNFSVAPGGHENDPLMKSLLLDLRISNRARQVAKEFYDIKNYIEKN